MRREKALFLRLLVFDNLLRAFRAASQGKRDRPEVREFEYHMESRLWEIRDQLATGVYPWGPYPCFRVRDPKRREIRAAPLRDRVVHHALFNVLDPVFRRGFIADSFTCIPGRGTHAAVHRYRAFVRARAGRGYRVQGDVRHYFANVDHAVLLDRLRRRIGTLTSQLFANGYLDALDHFVKEGLRVGHYLRYMDDFLLLASARREARAHLDAVRRVLAGQLRLELNPRRVVRRSDGQRTCSANAPRIDLLYQPPGQAPSSRPNRVDRLCFRKDDGGRL